MKTMQRASVLLLGVALLNVASAKRFIVTPTKMDGSDKKVSKLTQVWKDYDTLLEKQKAWIKTDEEFKKVDKEQKDLDAKIKRADRIVDEIKALDVTITTLEAAIKAEEDKVPAAKEKLEKAGDDAKADAKKELEELNEHIADMKKDPALVKARDDKKEAEAFKKQADKDYTTDPAKTDDDKKKLTWATQLDALDTKVTAAAKARDDAASPNQTLVNDKEPAKGMKPESGGTAYWITQLVAAAAQFASNVDTLPTQATVESNFQDLIKPLGGAWDEVTVEGFAGDVHKDNTFFISTPDDWTLKRVQDFFTQENMGQYKGKKVPDHQFATVKEAEDKDQPSLTLDTLVKIGDSTPLTYEENNPSDPQKPLDLKDRAARINGFVIGIEKVQATRTQYIPDPTDAKKPQIIAKDGEKDAMETYEMKYLTIQGLGLDVYMGSGEGPHTMFYVRDGEHGMKYEVVGNQMEMSVKQGSGSSSSGDSAKDKAEGSKTWMIIAIICLVILALGGIYFAYQAYNGSGSLQNTDI